jgi:hypothetical protein
MRLVQCDVVVVRRALIGRPVTYRGVTLNSAEVQMFPISKDALSLREISDYWSREINATSKELFRILEAAWWLGEFRGDSFYSPLQLLKKMFTSMHQRDDLGIVFLVGNSAEPLPIDLPDGSMRVDVRQRIRVPSVNVETWDEISCQDAYQALAKTCSLDSYPEIAITLAWIRLSYEEFVTWLAKRGYSDPTFWRPPQRWDRVDTSKKRWKAKLGDKNILTHHEEAVLSAINELFPNGELDHKAKLRDKSIKQHLASPVSSRTIQRALAKIEFG